jgi:hypothetical protein
MTDGPDTPDRPHDNDREARDVWSKRWIAATGEVDPDALAAARHALLGDPPHHGPTWIG